MIEIKTKDDLLNKLRSYTQTPDDDNIKYKTIIKNALLNCPELLYALNSEKLESELFDEDGNILMDDDGKLIGNVDEYFGDDSYIRPSLFIPGTQETVRNYVCYQVMFDELPRHSEVQKYTEVIFNVFVRGNDRTDKLTGISRHDLIASIIRERFNWSNIFGMHTKLITNKESMTDNNFVVRTLIFQIKDVNGITNTPFGGKTIINNYKVRR